MQEIETLVTQFLGLDATELATRHMVARAIVVYIVALVMVRMGEKRFFGKNTAFDITLGIIFGSVVSRAINGSARFFPTLAAGLTLVLLHWLFAALSFHFGWFGTLVKGKNKILVKDGKILWDAMERDHISEEDLMSELRSQANINTLDKVEEARLERSGDISVIKTNS